MDSKARIEVFEGEDGLHYFRVKDANNEVIAASEGYEGGPGAASTAAANLIESLGGDHAQVPIDIVEG